MFISHFEAIFFKFSISNMSGSGKSKSSSASANQLTHANEGKYMLYIWLFVYSVYDNSAFKYLIMAPFIHSNE